VNEFPVMTVGILEGILVHKTIVFGLGMAGAAVGESFCDEGVDFCSGFAGEAEGNFGGASGIADGFGGELAPFFVSESHDMYHVADDDAGGGVVGELSVVGVAEGFEESERAREINDGKVDEDFGIQTGRQAVLSVQVGLFFQRDDERPRRRRTVLGMISEKIISR
jgi:hypothetical protein